MNLSSKINTTHLMLKAFFLLILWSCEQTDQIVSETERPFCKDGKGLYLEMEILDDSSSFEDKNIRLNLCDFPNIPTEGSNWDKKWHQGLITRRSFVKTPVHDFEVEFEFWASYIPQEIDPSNDNSILALTFRDKPFIYGQYEEWKEDFAHTADSIYGLKGSLKESYIRLILRTENKEFVSISNTSLPDNFDTAKHGMVIDNISKIAFEDPEFSVSYTHLIEGTFNTLLSDQHGHYISLENGRFRLPINFPI